MREVTVTQTSQGTTGKEPTNQQGKRLAGSRTWKTKDATVVCFPTPVAPGFVLWTPHGPDTRLDETSTGCPTSATSSVLVLMFTWLFCSPQSAFRYVNLYIRRGWHVLHISSQLLHFLYPPRSRSFAQDVGRVLKQNCGNYAHVVVHAMSIGAYNYTTCLMEAREQPNLQIYLLSKLRAVVFDSLTIGSLDHMVKGIATGLSQWAVIQTAMKSLANLYLYLTYNISVKFFDEGVEFFRTNPVLVPTLVFGSENDPMSEVKALHGLLQDWSGRVALPLSFRVWEKSGHCAHLLHHGEEYQQVLHQFLLSLTSVPSPGDGDGQEEQRKDLVSKL